MKTGFEYNAKNSNNVLKYILNWVKRAKFVNGIGGLYNVQKEIFVKVNGKKLTFYHFHIILILLQEIIINRSNNSNFLRIIKIY